MKALNTGQTQDMAHGEIYDSHQCITDEQTNSTYHNQFLLGWYQIYLGRFDRTWTSSSTVGPVRPVITNLLRVISVMGTY